MIIGFSQESQTVSESGGYDYFKVEIPVSSQKVSEQYHIIAFRYLEPSSNATTVGYNGYNSQYDAMFGNEYNSVLADHRTLLQGNNLLSTLFTTLIRNDFLIEDQECFVIVVLPGELNGYHQPYFCNDTLGYYCKHTICIDDDDGKG